MKTKLLCSCGHCDKRQERIEKQVAETFKGFSVEEIRKKERVYWENRLKTEREAWDFYTKEKVLGLKEETCGCHIEEPCPMCETINKWFGAMLK